MARKREDDKNWADRGRIDFHRCYNEAEGYYLAGLSLDEISERLSLDLERLRDWEKEYQWKAKRAAMITSPRGIGAMLRERLQRQMEKMSASTGDLEVDEVKKITELTLLINKTEGAGGNVLAAMVEVLRDFSRYLREHIGDRDQYHLVSSWVQEYLRSKTDV
jgi:uncharacterized protein YjcR